MVETGSLTRVAEPTWTERPAGYRAWETTTTLGSGDELWRWAIGEVLRWGVKTRSGFRVQPATRVVAGDRRVIVAHPFGLAIREPVEVVDVVDADDRVGFAYRTLPGHPVTGEEAFIVHRSAASVLLTIRSLTRPGTRWHWRVAYPALLVAQRVARHRYLRALHVRAAR